MPEFRTPDAGRLDIPSAALSLVAILSVIWGVKDIATEVRRRRRCSRSPAAWWSASSSSPASRGSRTRSSTSLCSATGSHALAANVTGAMVMYGIFLFTSQFMQLGLGLSPLEAGLLGLPGIAAMMVVSTMTPKIVGLVRPAYAIALGMIVSALGMAMLTQVGADSAWVCSSSPRSSCRWASHRLRRSAWG